MKCQPNKAANSFPGYWIPDAAAPVVGYDALRHAARQVTKPIFVIAPQDEMRVSQDGCAVLGKPMPADVVGGAPLAGYAPALSPSDLGAPAFKNKYGIRFAYVGGAMANGITSVDMVESFGRAGMIAFFGAAGLPLADIRDAIEDLSHRLGEIPYGINLIHSPNEPELEKAAVDLFLEKKIRVVSASAYLRLTPALIKYRVSGIYRNTDGTVICPNRIIAKVSRVEVARRFLSPPPEKILRRLLESGQIEPSEAELSRHVPVADDLTAEADSGGHTDNRPAISLLPTMMAVRDEMTARHQYTIPVCVGLAGGIATPCAAAAAFSMGAAYVLTGSINQACVESGSSEIVKQMLAEAQQADVTMAPAADMFEMGVKVQVLKRGTMFPLRASKLYELYRTYDGFEDIPEKDRNMVENKIFQGRFDEIWEQTKRFFMDRDPRQIEKGEKNPKHRMALVFRWYLGRSSGWANMGDPERKMDYQIWCGPSMGAFNEWSRNSFLAEPSHRRVVTVAMNLLLGACVQTRLQILHHQGVGFPSELLLFRPMEDAQIQEYF